MTSKRKPKEGRFSKVTRRMWNDERFTALSAAKPNAQTLWMRLMTGPELGCIPGVFTAREGGLADALGWSLGAFRKCWREIEAAGLAEADWSKGLVFIPKAVHHNEPEAPNVVLGWRMAWAELPECALKAKAQAILNAHMVLMGEPWAKAFAKAIGKPSPYPLPDPSPNQEQEQDQEQDLTCDVGPKDLTGHARDPAPGPAAANDSDQGSETVCPLDLEQRAVSSGAVAAMAKGHGVSEPVILDAVREFVAYWTIGGGAGERRRNWLTKLRQRVHELAQQNKLKPEGAIAHEDIRELVRVEQLEKRRAERRREQVIQKALDGGFTERMKGLAEAQKYDELMQEYERGVERARRRKDRPEPEAAAAGGQAVEEPERKAHAGGNR